MWCCWLECECISHAVTGLRTWLGYGGDVHALLLSHEAQHWENGKTCQETGAAVQEAKEERVPER